MNPEMSPAMKIVDLGTRLIPMSRIRRLRSSWVVALVPLAVLSGAWSISLASSDAASAPNTQAGLPVVLDTPVAVPVSVTTLSAGGGEGLQVPGSPEQIVATASAFDIPSAALAAYQRAQTVIDAADPSCHLPWQLVAAIGRVESDHGRFGGNVLMPDGVATPGVYGIALDGRSGTAVIRDTDAGQLDHDTSFDRAVGPMQFIPSTWASVGVDGDGDGTRNPQDIDDASLAAAVYLCSGADDLATEVGQRTAVYRYNHSVSYVDLVSALALAYMAGDAGAAPVDSWAAGHLSLDSVWPSREVKPTNHVHRSPEKQPVTPSDHEAQRGPDTPPAEESGGGGGRTPVLAQDELPELPHTEIEPVDTVLTMAQAVVHCALEGVVAAPGPDNQELEGCSDLLTEE